MTKKRSNSEWDDWKSWRRGWPYKKDAPDDKKYIKDRDELFKEAGNGWWWYQGTTMWKKYYNKNKLKKKWLTSKRFS